MFFGQLETADWYPHGERKSLYDQQPVEAAMMADAALAAFGQTRDDRYLTIFCRAHDWFHGRNSLQEPLADFQSGACFDGLERSGVNRNQGAESTLAFLLAEVHRREMQLVVDDTLAVTAAALDTRRIPATRPMLIGQSDSVALRALRGLTMNWSQMHADWPELQEVLKTYWSDLSWDDLNAINGNRDELARLLQQRRALGPDQIEKEIIAFENEARFPGEVK